VEVVVYFDAAESYPEDILWVDLVLLDSSKLRGQIKYIPNNLGHKLKQHLQASEIRILNCFFGNLCASLVTYLLHFIAVYMLKVLLLHYIAFRGSKLVKMTSGCGIYHINTKACGQNN
jgi:uncharacterized membrane protein